MALSETLNLDISQAERQIDTLQKKIDGLRASIAKSGGGTGFSTGDLDKATSATGRLQKAFDGLAASGAKLASAGRSLSGLSLPIIAIGFAADRAAIKFEDTFLRIQTLTNTATKDLGKFRDATLNLAGTFGQGPQDLAEALFFITSNGIQGAKALDVLKVSAKGAALQLGTTQVVASNITSIMNAYGESNLSAARVLDILVASEKESKTAAAELISQYGRVLPAASVLGVSFEEVSGILSFFTRTTGSASQAGTQLSNILNKMIKPSVEAKNVLKSIGITSVENFNALVRQNGVLNTTQLIFDKLGKDPEKFAKVFGNIRGIAGALQLVGPNADEARAAIERVQNSIGAADAAFRQLQNNPAFQRKQAFAEFQAALIELGELIIPIGNQILQFGKSIAEAFIGLPKPIQNVVLAVAGFIAVIGPAALGIGKLIQGIGDLGSAILAVPPPLLAVGALLAAGTALYLAYTSEQRAAAKAAKEFRGSLQDSAQALDIEAIAVLNAADAHRQYNDVVNEGVNTSFKKKLTDKNQIDDLNRLGISLQDVTKINGTAAEQEALLNRVRERAFATGEITLRLNDQNIKSTGKHTEAQQKLIDTFLRTGSIQDARNRGVNAEIRGNTDLIRTFENQSTAAKLSTDQLVQLTNAGDAQAAAILKARGEWDLLTPAQQRAAQGQLDLAAAGKALQENQQADIGTLNETQQKLADLETQASDTAVSYDDLAKAVDDARDAVSKFLGIPLDAAEQQLKWNEALADFAKATKESNLGITESTSLSGDQLAQVRKNEEGYIGLAKTIQDNVSENLKHGDSIDTVKKKYDEQRAQLELIGISAGLSKEEMDAYNTTLGLTPDAVDTAIALAGVDENQRKLDEYNQLLSALPPDVQTLIKEVGAKDAQAGVDLLAQKLLELPPEQLTAVGITGREQMIQILTDLGLDVTKLGDLTAEPTVDPKTETADADLKKTSDAVTALDKKQAKPTVGVNNQASSKIASINAELEGIGKKVVTPTVNVVGNAFSQLGAIIQRLQAVGNQAATTRALVNSVGSGPTSVPGAKTGAIFGAGGVRRMREGGIVGDRLPAIGRTTSGAGILWAEPETGGESYIPHGLRYRSRAIGLTRETAKMFGYDLVPKGMTPQTSGPTIARLSDPHISDLTHAVVHMSKTVRRLESKVGDVNVTVEGNGRSAKALGSELGQLVAAAR